jgi:hypothetical protein
MRRPSTCTVQAPHSPRSQPFFVPVSASCSRKASSSVVRGSTVTVRGSPLTSSFTATRCRVSRMAPSLMASSLVRHRLR